MDADLKRKWIEALRSGEYAQCRMMLHDDAKDNKGFCCLGVLCEVSGYPVEGAIEISYRWVQDTVGKHYQPLIDLNDHERAPFSQIADYIEQNL